MVQLAVQVFCKEVVRYHLPVLMNQLLSSHHFTFYLDIDKVKSYRVNKYNATRFLR